MKTSPTMRVKGMSSRKPPGSLRKSPLSIFGRRGRRGGLSLSLGVGERMSERECERVNRLP